MANKTVHPGWLGLAGHMVRCPRCGVPQPAVERAWRWTGREWRCRRLMCVLPHENPAGVERVPEEWADRKKRVEVEVIVLDEATLDERLTAMGF